MLYTKENISDIYTLTPMQEGMYYFYKLDNHSQAYVQQSSIRFIGEIDLTAVKASLNILFERHDILRTVFVDNLADRILQVVLKRREINFEYKDFVNAKNIEESLSLYRQEVRNIPFYLNRDVLLRLGIVRTSERCHELIWTFHHIILDGWCAAIAINEFFEIYRCMVNNQSLHLDKPIQFKEYILWLEKQDLKESLSYWKNYFRNHEHISSFVKKTNTDGRYTKADHVEVIHENLITRLKKIAIINQVTLYTVFQTVWGLLLARYNDTNDVAFGSVVSGRPSQIEGVDKILGMFINTMPVRVKFEEEQSFTELLKSSQVASFQSQQHAYAPLKEIQKQHATGRELFDHIIAFENLPTITNSSLTEAGTSGFNIEFYFGGAEGQTNFDLDVSFIPGPEFIFQLSYNAHTFDSIQIQTIAQRFIRILSIVAEKGDVLIREIELTGSEETNKILNFNAPPADRQEKEIVSLLKTAAQLHKERTAIYCDGYTLSYSVLDELSDSVAANLIACYRIRRGDRVGLHLSRTENLLIAMLGILKTGAAFVPMDTELPVNRIVHMTRSSSVNCIVTESKTALSDFFDNSTLANVGELIRKVENAEQGPMPAAAPNDLAYILFTSGSTGEPKGVMIEHHSLADYVLTFKEYFAVSCEDKVIMQSSVSFDTMIEEIFPALISGASVLMVPNGGKDTETILDLIKHKKASILTTTPHVIYELNKYPDITRQLRVLISGGDKLKSSYISRLIGEVDIYNTYGPTESTVCATFHKVTKPGDAHVIGKPIVNRQVYIFSRSGHIQPIGLAGELCIGGEGIARGYLDQEQTSPSFKPDPFYPEKTLYYTGDRARWNDDGTIEFIERTDHQVKIRGYRIELNEIEKCIGQFENIDDACVIANADRKCLYAYFTSQRTIAIEDLRTYMLNNLPDYMVPADFMQVEKFPLLHNGKIDIRTLPDFQQEACTRNTDSKARNQFEEYLEEIWSEVLNKESIGIFDNYFSLGGDSIKSIQILAKLRRKGYKFDLRDIFHYPTIAQLSERISKIDRIPVQTTVKGNIPLTPIQRSFFELQKTDRHHYNHAILISCASRLEPEGVRQTFYKLSTHHDALRIVFTEKNGTIIQTNQSTDLVPEIYEFDYRLLDNCESAMQHKMNELHSGFNLQKGPLMKVAVFHLPEGDRLFIMAHHLIIDGISWRILLEDFQNLYTQYIHGKELDLPLKTDSYKFWAESLKLFSKSKQLLRQTAYWEKIESEVADAIPYEFIGEPCKAATLDHKSLVLDPTLTAAIIGHVNIVYNTHINDILICGLGLALSSVFGVKKVLISVEGHGREKITDDIDVSRTIGWFTSQYPVLLDMSSSDLSDAIRVVKETMHRIPMNGIGYSVLKYLSSDEKPAVKFKQRPIIEFNYLGQFNSDIKGDHIDTVKEQPGKLLSDNTEFDQDIIITAIIPQDSLVLSIEYNKTRFSERTVNRLLEAYRESLIAIAAHCAGINNKILTPSDLTDTELTMDELDTIHNLTENI